MTKLSGFLCALTIGALAVAAGAGAVVGGSPGVTDGTSAAPSVDTGSAIVQLEGDPLSIYSQTRPAPGKKIDFSSSTVKSYRAKLAALRNDFKKWLRSNAPAAKVTGEYDIALNAVAVQLDGTPLSTLLASPQVSRAQYEGLYSPASDDPDLPLINAFAAWGGETQGAGAGVTADGRRIRVGIVDTGIDVSHPCFDDSGFVAPPGFPKGDNSLTNDKVIVAKVFYNKANVQGLTAAAIQEHGTHVAGTVACDYGLSNSTTNVNGVSVPYGVLGVAPGAQLGSYNVFPGDVSNARSEDILNALEAAYTDGMDVVNMSLGGGARGVQDLLTDAVDDLDQAGMVSAVAAGNSGPGHFTVESPGSAARALTAGAMTVGHFIGSPVTVSSSTYGVAAGDFARVTADLTAPLQAVLSGTSLSTACSALPAGSLTGKIALISRGACTFSTKIRNAEAAGALATLVVNNTGGDPVAMAQDGTPNQPVKPAYMAGLADKAALMAASGSSATIGVALTYFNTTNDNIMAAFSSQGPTDVDFRVKPDVVAPGVNVLSSIPASFCDAAPCWAFFQGTSMATPHLAGSAAVVLGQNPALSAAQVRSAIVNTADEGVLLKSSGSGLQTDVNIVGAGRDDLDNAVNAKVGLNPVSVSFGAVPSGSGQTRTAAVTLSSLDAGSGAYSAAVTNQTGGGVTFGATVSGDTVTVTMAAPKGTTAGGYQGILRVYREGDGEVAHAAVYALVK